ncbi:energy transducer TonB [Neisseria bacilliformis]|uniref:energy transducer TonB n=1 Tax=Neisseria bacilliformis TaxID=267212 RepID=UPI0028F1317F|nr:energy transducer TonB [Neisseria bacilliformis]
MPAQPKRETACSKRHTVPARRQTKARHARPTLPILLPVLLCAAAQAAPEAVPQTVKLPPLIRPAAADAAGFPQTGRAVFLLDADARGKVLRRWQQEADATVARQAATLPGRVPPHVSCTEGKPRTAGQVCRKVPYTAVQEVYFVPEKFPAEDDAQFVQAVETAAPQPDYPAAALENGEEGTVILRLVVGADGRAYAAQPVQSSGSPSLDRAAVKAMDGARFTPARFRGRPVWAAARRSIRFAIK